jgi:branched-chain amino acid transport system permease protein
MSSEGLNLPRTAGMIRSLLFFGVLVALPFVFDQPWLVNIAIFTLLYATLASAWNLVGGFAGYPSLGHAAFFGIGAYTLAIVYQHRGAGGGYGPLLASLPIGVAVAVMALPIGWIAMRTRADVFAIVTITLLFVVQSLAFNLHGLTGGSQGIALPAPPFDPAHFERPFYFASLVLLAVALAVSLAVVWTKTGLFLLAVRADEDKAGGIGVRVGLVKLTAFGLSAGLAGAAGAIWAYYVAFVYPQFAIDPLVTIGMVLMTYLGGRATLWGPVVGAFLLTPLQQYLAYRFGGAQLYLIGYAAVFLVIMLVLPQGILAGLANRSGLSVTRRPRLIGLMRQRP